MNSDWAFGLAIMMTVVFLGLIGYTILVDVPDRVAKVNAEAMECERRGGVFLDRTYNSGKTTGHIYTCINKNVVIW